MDDRRNNNGFDAAVVICLVGLILTGTLYSYQALDPEGTDRLISKQRYVTLVTNSEEVLSALVLVHSCPDVWTIFESRSRSSR